MLDLYNKKYDMKTLEKYIHEVKLIDILKTQTINITFAVRFILNSKYQLNEDDNIIAPDIIKYQPHISYEELQKALQYDSDDSDDSDNK